MSHALHAVVVALGLATAAYGAFLGRTRSDVKTLLAYASMAQVGLVFAEIGCGWSTLALAHLVGHAALRTWQLLRAPSALREWRDLELAGDSGQKAAAKPQRNFELLYPKELQRWLYRQAIARGNLKTFIHAYLVAPLFWLAHRIDQAEQRLIEGLEGAVGGHAATLSGPTPPCPPAAPGRAGGDSVHACRRDRM
jgi:NAD(P)H-quinone oxidoreductase subunit 5